MPKTFRWNSTSSRVLLALTPVDIKKKLERVKVKKKRRNKKFWGKDQRKRDKNESESAMRGEEDREQM